jgi:pimeloyl-ACP methyl ester carboxylesterase
MPFLKRDRTQLYFEEHGDGPALVFAHGVGGNHASWFHQIAAFAPSFRVVVFDARGFGNSVDEEELGRSGFVDDLASLLDELKIDRPILVGQSMGGGACLSFTCAYPERVRGLVLADTLMGFALPDEIREFMSDLTKRATQWTQLERVLGQTFRRENPALSVLYTQLASFNRVNVKTLKGVQKVHTPEALAATRVPTLFIAGEEDVLFPPHAVKAVQCHVGGSHYIEIRRGGHSAYFEEPTVFNQVLGGWIATLS